MIENNGTSAGEGSTRSGSSAPESPAESSGSTSVHKIPEQKEPLCLVTWKNSTSLVEQQHNRDEIPRTSPILFQTLKPLVTSGPTAFHELHPSSPPTEHPVMNLTSAPIDPNLLRYSSNFPPSYYSAFPSGQTEILQHYAALHAEYLRSLIALSFYPHM